MPAFAFTPVTVPPRPAIPGLQETLASQFARARQNILGTVPRGGGLFSALAGLESERAQAVTGLASQREQQAFQDQLLQSEFNQQAARVSAGFNLQNQQLVNQQNQAGLQAELTRAQLAMQRQAQTNQALSGLGLGLLGVGGQLLPRLLFPSQFPRGSRGGGGIGPGDIVQQFSNPLLNAFLGNTGGGGSLGGSLGAAGSFGDPISFLEPAFGGAIGAAPFDLPSAFGGALGAGGTALGALEATAPFDLPAIFGGALGAGGAGAGAGVTGFGAAALPFAPLLAIAPLFGGHLHGAGLGPPTAKAQSWINQQLATGLNLDQAVENLITQHKEWLDNAMENSRRLFATDPGLARGYRAGGELQGGVEALFGPSEQVPGGQGITQSLIIQLLRGKYGRPDLADTFEKAVRQNATTWLQFKDDFMKQQGGTFLSDEFPYDLAQRERMREGRETGQGGPPGLEGLGLPALTERGS